MLFWCKCVSVFVCVCVCVEVQARVGGGYGWDNVIVLSLANSDFIQFVSCWLLKLGDSSRIAYWWLRALPIVPRCDITVPQSENHPSQIEIAQMHAWSISQNMHTAGIFVMLWIITGQFWIVIILVRDTFDCLIADMTTTKQRPKCTSLFHILQYILKAIIDLSLKRKYLTGE